MPKQGELSTEFQQRADSQSSALATQWEFACDDLKFLIAGDFCSGFPMMNILLFSKVSCCVQNHFQKIHLKCIGIEIILDFIFRNLFGVISVENWHGNITGCHRSLLWRTRYPNIIVAFSSLARLGEKCWEDKFWNNTCFQCCKRCVCVHINTVCG